MSPLISTERPSLAVTEEQVQLLDIATTFCRDKSPVEKVRSLLEDDLGYDPDVWQEMADLGWLGIAIPEEFGGIGLSLTEVVPVVEQMGRTLMAGPFVPTTLAAQLLLKAGTEAQKASWLPQLASGAKGAVALMEEHVDWNLTNLVTKADRANGKLVLQGRKLLVQDAASADITLATVSLEGQPAIVMLTKADLEGRLRREGIIDETRRSYEITLDGLEIDEAAVLSGGDVAAALAHYELVASLLLAAEMCGGSASVIAYTVEYLNTRKQFDKIIGSFQALKHPIVDAHVAYETARSHLYCAASNFSEQGKGEVATRMAKAEANEAFAFAADRSIQFHGGFGFTYDCDAQLYRRRAMWCEAQHGDATYHRRKLADLMLQ